MSDKKSPTYLTVYVGMDESFVDSLYIDLVVDGEEFTLVTSPESLYGGNEKDMVDILEKILEKARKLSKSLKLPLVIVSEEIVDGLGGDDLEKETIRKIRQGIRDSRQ